MLKGLNNQGSRHQCVAESHKVRAGCSNCNLTANKTVSLLANSSKLVVGGIRELTVSANIWELLEHTEARGMATGGHGLALSHLISCEAISLVGQ